MSRWQRPTARLAAILSATALLAAASSCNKDQPPPPASPTADAARSAPTLPPTLTADTVDLPPDVEGALSGAFLPGRMFDLDDSGVVYTVMLSAEEPDGAIAAVNVSDGREKWRFPLSDIEAPEGRVTQPGDVIVACSNERAHFRTRAGIYGAIDGASGKPLYTKDILYLGAVTGLAADDSLGYLLVRSGLRGLDAATGEERWAFYASAPLADTAAPGEGLLFAVDAAWVAYRVDTRTGEVVWERDLLGDRASGLAGLQSGALSATEDYVAALLPTAPRGPERPPAKGVLTVCDAATGRVLWSREFEEPYPARTVLVGGACVVSYVDPDLRTQLVKALDLASGRELWETHWIPTSWAAPGALAWAGTKPLDPVRPGVWIVNPRTGAEERYIRSDTLSACGLFARKGKLYAFCPVLPEVSALAGTFGFVLPTS
jgi:outer membrane protein assembly factor BamB